MKNFKLWLKAAAIRAVKTFAQVFASLLTVGAAIREIDWAYTVSVAAVSAIYSIATSVGGLPEVEYQRSAAQIEESSEVDSEDDDLSH